MKAVKVAGVFIAGGTLTLGLMAAPAFASTYVKNASNVSTAPPSGAPCSPVYVDGGTLVGKACFQSYGDRFWVRDMRADGMRIDVRASYAGNPQTLFICQDRKGAAAGWTRCTFHSEMNEDQGINFAAMLIEKDGSGVAKTGWTVTGTS